MLRKKKSPPVSSQHLTIVGLGASAGGLDAFKQFVRAIPAESGMAYVLVQHLAPAHESLLKEIIARETSIPVFEIVDDIHLDPDTIYIIPPNKILTATDGVLKLSPREGDNRNMPIDIFFTSLAEVHKELAIGVVLSGTGHDGTAGLKSIKENNGISFAQDPASAAFEGMPQSAIDAEVVDFVMTPAQIPAHILGISSVLQLSVTNTEDGEEGIWKDKESYKQILTLLRLSNGVDFTFYKQPTMRRRIARRLALARFESLAAYYALLQEDKVELRALHQDLLIPVTSFFRDPKTFAALSNSVFPAILKTRKEVETIRIWVAACSSGEEAVSIAICLHEYLNDSIHHGAFGRVQVQILASDVSEKAIAKARAGLYSKADVEMLSHERQMAYFTKVGNQYQVSRTIRDMCVFAVHNFVKDPPFSRMDVISCRNVLIYMDPFLQKKALITFHYALKKNGFMLLGKSETSSPAAELFTTFAKDDKIFSRKDVPGRFIYIDADRKEARNDKSDDALPIPQLSQTDFRKSGEAVILAKYTPAGVIVNEHMEVVHIHGAVTPFIVPPPGKPTYNIIKLAREGLGFEIRSLLHKAKAGTNTVIKEDIPITENGTPVLVTIEITPLSHTVGPHYLVIFRNRPLPEKNSISRGAGAPVEIGELKARNEQLEKEIAHLRFDMGNITEDQEGANEELQSANEELLSSSEELQSLNEELETSKEELQSSNEELIIINQEMLDKQEQLNTAKLLAEAIVATIHEPLLVLDQALRVKSANSSFYTRFRVAEKEIIGKVIYEMQDHAWDVHGLRKLLENILPKKVEIVNHELSINLPSLGQSILLLNASQIHEGTSEASILLAIEDITERKLTEHNVKEFSDALEVQVTERTFELMRSNLTLHQTIENLRKANNELEQYCYVISHDLQEPLRKIIVFSGLLQRQFSNELSGEARKMFNRLVDSSLRMKTLVEDLLNYACVIGSDGEPVSTDLNEVLKNILKDYELVIEDKKAKIQYDNLAVINAVPIQMNQLFYNLVGNALKFCKENQAPLLSITSRSLSNSEIQKHPTLDKGVDYCEVIFKDNGIGFEPDYSDRIFTIFQRLNTTKLYPGTGIGLSVCKKIVECHRGIIFANAVLNEGASFHVILPI